MDNRLVKLLTSLEQDYNHEWPNEDALTKKHRLKLLSQINECKSFYNLEYVCDKKRHLVCIPYSKENLHRMANDLNIKRCWFHKNHYDIPKRRIIEIQGKCRIVTSREIVKIIKG